MSCVSHLPPIKIEFRFFPNMFVIIRSVTKKLLPRSNFRVDLARASEKETLILYVRKRAQYKGLTRRQQLLLSDVEYGSGNFSKHFSKHFANGHVPH